MFNLAFKPFAFYSTNFTRENIYKSNPKFDVFQQNVCIKSNLGILGQAMHDAGGLSSVP